MSCLFKVGMFQFSMLNYRRVYSHKNLVERNLTELGVELAILTRLNSPLISPLISHNFWLLLSIPSPQLRSHQDHVEDAVCIASWFHLAQLEGLALNLGGS